MRKVLIKIILIIGLPVGFSIFYYDKLAVFYGAKTNLRKKMDYLYESGDRPDVIFLGSSRVLNDIDPRIIDSVLGTRSYNLGAEQVTIPEMRMLFNVCLECGKRPRVLVVNLDPATFQVDVPVYDFTDILYYSARDTVVYNSMAEIQDVYACRWKYPFYRLQQLTSINDGFKVQALLKSKEAFRKEVHAADQLSPGITYANGYIADYNQYEESYVHPFDVEFQEKGLDLLQDIIDTCRRRRIRVVFVTAPMYFVYREKFLNSSAVLSRVSELARRDSIPYLNLIDDSLLTRHKEDFFNFVHLNAHGAELYSLEVAELLKGMDTAPGHVTPINH
jgi:hypothetical protein